MEGIIGLYNYVMIYLTGILFFVTTALLFIINTHLDGALIQILTLKRQINE